MKKAFVLLLALMVVMGLTLVAVACGEEEETTTTAAATETTAAAAEALDWADAKDNLGVTATVSGPVVSVETLAFADNKVLVNIGVKDETGFCVAIEGYDTDKFTGLDETMVGKTVTVTGEIYENEFDHWAEITISDPSEWEVTGEGSAAVTVLDWADAKANLGETATVSGPVVVYKLLTFADNKVLIILGEETEDGFAVAIEGYDTDKFTGLDETMVGKTVTVTGEIYENEFDHWAEITIADPSEWTVE